MKRERERRSERVVVLHSCSKYFTFHFNIWRSLDYKAHHATVTNVHTVWLADFENDLVAQYFETLADTPLSPAYCCIVEYSTITTLLWMNNNGFLLLLLVGWSEVIFVVVSSLFFSCGFISLRCLWFFSSVDVFSYASRERKRESDRDRERERQREWRKNTTTNIL